MNDACHQRQVMAEVEALAQQQAELGKTKDVAVADFLGSSFRGYGMGTSHGKFNK